MIKDVVRRALVLFKIAQPITWPYRVAAAERRTMVKATLVSDFPLLVLMTGLNRKDSKGNYRAKACLRLQTVSFDGSQDTVAGASFCNVEREGREMNLPLTSDLSRSSLLLEEKAWGRTPMLGGRSYRENIGKQTWPISVWITLALLLFAAMRYATKLYMVQEILVVLLLVAVSTVTILVLVVAVILFQEGIRRTALWAKSGLQMAP
jgi:hypothetical protein